MPADSASEIVKFTISIPRESCINAKAKYSSSVVPPDPSVHFTTGYKCNDCASVCPLVTTISCAKAAEPTRDAVWDVDFRGPKEPCIRWQPRSPQGKGQFGGISWPIVKYRV